MTRPELDKIEQTHIAIIHESWRQSAARDLTTAAIFLGLWSIGYYAGSAAMEWTGVLLASIVLCARALTFFKWHIDRRMTPDQARAWLDERFPK